MGAEIKRNADFSKRTTMALLAEVKSSGEDHEWFPTTTAMLDVIKRDMEEECDDYPSVLDIGAGDGRALLHLTKGKRYAIEKSQPLLQSMDRSIFIVGTEFQQQTLIDKKISITFSNPPYKKYDSWTKKIIKEANCQTVYLIIPQRWRENVEIAEALKCREATSDIIDSFDFLSADRASRAKVDIVRVNLGYKSRHGHSSSARTDPFSIWFDSEFRLQINNNAKSKFEWSAEDKATQKEKVKSELVKGGNIISILETLYLAELSNLMENYRAIERLDYSVLKELDVNIQGLKDALKLKIEGLKDRYWQELFDNLHAVTSRLTTDARKKMVDKLTEHTHVDFTASNAHALIIWCVKNANAYFDDQLVTLVDRMTERASVVLYKSNSRVYTENDWRYHRTPSDLQRYSLEYRIVLDRVGGLNTSSWEHERRQHNGLSQRAFDLISDIITVSANLNFNVSKTIGPASIQWESNKAVEFLYYNENDQSMDVLFVVRAYKNGNLHIKFNQSLICRLNVEFGRLRGWIKTASQASSELNIDIEHAEIAFGSNVQLGSSSVLRLCSSGAVQSAAENDGTGLQ